VTQKAFARGLKAIVVINKIDRPGARPDWVLNETFDLFDRLDATEEQLDFPVVYASAFRGYAGHDAQVSDGDMAPLFETIVEQVPPPPVDRDGPFQMQVSSLDYSSYVGAIGIGRIARGSVGRNSPVVVVDGDGHRRNARILQVLRSEGLERRETERASAGDIVAVTGIEAPNISDTLCDPEAVEALPPLTVDEPTVSMDFLVNTSPLAGRDGRFLTSRQIRERLARELIHNVALGSRIPATRIASWSPGGASCISRSSSRTCAGKATSSPSPDRGSSCGRSTGSSASPSSSSPWMWRRPTRAL
jgi:GTP-binding protein